MGISVVLMKWKMNIATPHEKLCGGSYLSTLRRSVVSKSHGTLTVHCTETEKICPSSVCFSVCQLCHQTPPRLSRGYLPNLAHLFGTSMFVFGENCIEFLWWPLCPYTPFLKSLQTRSTPTDESSQPNLACWFCKVMLEWDNYSWFKSPSVSFLFFCNYPSKAVQRLTKKKSHLTKHRWRCSNFIYIVPHLRSNY